MISKLSKTGTDVYQTGKKRENQDAVCCGRSRKFSVISLADGASSCKRGGKGARTACEAITNLLLKKGNYFLEFENDQIAGLALSHILHELKQKAAEDSEQVEEYSSTVASVLVDKREGRLLCFSIGDSLILASGSGRCRVLSAPADSRGGCCVTTTRNAESMASVKVAETDFLDSVVICSDGAWRQMYAGNRLRPEAASLLAASDFEGLKKYLSAQDCPDDCSFVAVDLRRKNGRKSA